MPAETVEVIRHHHRERMFAMEQRKRSDLALMAFLRTALGWRKDGDADANKYAATRAQQLVKIGEQLVKEAGKPEEKRKEVAGVQDEDFAALRPIITASIMAREPFDSVEASATKQLEKLAKTLPVWPWVDAIKGFGAVGLATIVAEAGDLSNYSNPAKLWKRMGVGLAKDGGGQFVRQGGLSKSASADLWTEHGYNRQRRSRMFVIGDSLLKTNGDGEYRALYLERKEYERAKAEAEGLKVVPAAKIPRGKQAEYRSDGHIHRRAQRYMEKRLLRDLWRAWREAKGRKEPTGHLPPAEAIAAE